MSRFDQQYLYEFETAIDPAATEAGGDPVEPTWAGPSQEEWTQAQERLSQFDQMVSANQAREDALRQAYGGNQQTDQFDQIREAVSLLGVDWKDFIAAVRADAVDPAVAPFQQTQQVVSEQQYGELVADIAADVAARTGDFDREIAELFAQRILEGEIQKAGGDIVRGLEATMEKSAQQARDYEKKIREAAIAQHTNQLSTLAGVPGEPGSQYSVGVQQRTVPDFRKGGSVVERMFGQTADMA